MMYQLLKLDDKEIVEMVFFPVINEACQVLSEGIANKASDLDIASIFGMGFPPYRCFLSLWKMQIRFNLSDNDWTLNSMYKLPDNNSWTLNNIVCFWQQQLNFENSDKLLNWLCNQGWHRVLGRFHRRKAHSRKAIRVGDEAWPVVQALLIPVRKGSRRCSSGEKEWLLCLSHFRSSDINKSILQSFAHVFRMLLFWKRMNLICRAPPRRTMPRPGCESDLTAIMCFPAEIDEEQ